MCETDEFAQRRSSFSCAVPLVIIDSLSRRSFSYNKLPQKPLKLTVLKLDNSSFGILFYRFFFLPFRSRNLNLLEFFECVSLDLCVDF